MCSDCLGIVNTVKNAVTLKITFLTRVQCHRMESGLCIRSNSRTTHGSRRVKVVQVNEYKTTEEKTEQGK